MNSRERWWSSTSGVNLSGEELDTRQQAQRFVTLVFMIPRHTRMLA